MQLYHRCWIIGAGAVGSVIATILSENQAMETYLVGTSVHAKKVREMGLIFEMVGDEPSVVSLNLVSPEEVSQLNEQDLVLMTGKASLLDKTLGWLHPKCGSGAGVIALQNGMGPDQVISRGLGRPVDRGLVFFGAHSDLPGHVRYYPGAICLRSSPAAEFLCKLLEGSAIKCQTRDDFKEIEWLKLAINCIANPLAGILNADNRGVA